ncbi:unnamed protein product [Durusdinium trenchii]|uniref:Uncharacterized protein n=1 Tax=Durusdinium trenchii TaxID=1381693 RepID=A0ABP0JJA6_9DINO
MDYLIGSCHLPIDDLLLNKFWSHLDSVQDPWALSTSDFRKAAGANVIPLGFYGDEACIGLVTDPYNQIYGLLMSVVLFRPTSTRMSRFLLCSVDSHRIESAEGTFYPVLEKITESFNRLSSEGVHGRRCLVSEIRGDQAFFKYMFKHESWWRHTNVCFRCRATSKPTPLNYCIYESADGWNTTCRSTQQFIEEQGMMLDAGIFGDVSQGYAVALGEAYENFTRWRKINKIQSSQKRFTPGQLLRDGYGFFLNTKGFNARLISQWLFDLVRAHPTGDPRHEMVEVALTLGQNDRTAICRYFGLTERASRCLSLAEADSIEQAGKTFLLAYRRLNTMCCRMGCLAWVLTPKWHAMAHVLIDVVRKARTNPRMQHTFVDEDQMRVLKSWAKRSAGKRRPYGVIFLARMRYKSLRWRIPKLKQKRG